MGRIFLSHSSADNAAAIALRDWLVAEGWDDVFLDLDPDRGIVAGERWERALNEAATRCEAVVFLVSRSWLASRWCLKEFNLALRLNKRIFGVLVEDVPIADLPEDLTASWQAVPLARGADHAMFRVALPDGREVHVTFSKAGLQSLKNGLTKAGLDPRFFLWPPEDDPDRPPWRGMLPLEAEDAGIFFGRDAPVIEALDRLRGLADAAPPRLLVILGASGAGKSSFLRAGLLPRLQRDDRNFLTLPVIRPERAAITGEAEGLIASLEKAFTRAGKKKSRAALREATASAATLGPLLAELANASRLPGLADEPRPAAPAVVIALDQTEELFNASGGEEAETFLALLADLLWLEAVRVIVLATIRSDAYERLQTAPALEGVRQSTLSLPPMPRGAYQTVIEGPIARLKDTPRAVRIEPALTAALLADIEAGGGTDALPLLAFTLGRLFDEHGGDGDLTLAEYEMMGRIAGSVEAAVQRAFTRADADPAVPREREARLALLRRGLIPWLAGIDPDTGAPRRLKARLSDIPAESRPLIEHLVTERLLSKEQSYRPGEDGEGLVRADEATIEPVHEALLRQWGLLRGWLDEDFARLAALEAVRRAARDWDANARDAAWLAHQAGRLEDAERLADRPDLWAQLQETDRAYLAAARAAENARRERELDEARKLAEAQRLAAERQKQVARRTRIGAAAAVLLAALAGLFGWYGLERSREAQRQAELATERQAWAEVQRAEAERQAEIAKAEKERADTLRISALAAEADRYSTVAEGLLANRRPDLALSAALAVAPAGETDDRPLTPALTSVIQRSATRTPAHVVRRLSGNVRRLALSGDGELLASAGELPSADGGSEGGMLHLFDAATMQERFRIEAAEDYVVGLDFSPDSRSVATAGARNPAVFDTQNGTKKFDLALPDLTGRKPSKNVRYAPDGSYIVVSTLANHAIVYDADNGSLLHVLEAPAFEEVLARVEVEVSTDAILRAVNEATWTIFGGATEIAVSPDSSAIAVAGSSFDGGVQIFDSRTGMLRRQLSGGVVSDSTNVPMFGTQLAFTPDGSAIISALGSAVKVWDLASGKLRAETAAFGLTTFTVMGDSRSLIFGRDTGEVVSLCLVSPFDTTRLQAHSGPIDDILVSRDAKLLLTTSEDGTAKLWPLPTGGAGCGMPSYSRSQGLSAGISALQPLEVLPGHTGQVRAALGTAGDMVSYTGDKTGSLRAWFAAPVLRLDVDLQSFLPATSSPRWSNSAEILPTEDGALLFLWVDGLDGISALDLRTLSLVHVPAGIVSVATRPGDGPPILFTDVDQFWRLGDFPLARAREPIYGVEISPRGDRSLMSADSDSLSDDQALVDVVTGQRVSDLQVDGRVTRGLSFSPDGSTIIGRLVKKSDVEEDDFQLAEKRTEAIAVWDADTGQILAMSEGTPAELTGHTSDDGKRFLVREDDAGGNPRLIAFSLRGDALVGNPINLESGPYATAIAPDGRFAFFATSDGMVSIVDLDSTLKTRTLRLGVDQFATYLAVSPSGALLAALTDAGELVVMDVASDRQMFWVTLPRPPQRLLFAGNDTIVAIDDSDILHVFDMFGVSRTADLNALFPPSLSTNSEEQSIESLSVSQDERLAFIRAKDTEGLFALNLATGARVDVPSDVVNVFVRGEGEEPLLLNNKGYLWQFGEPSPTAGPSDRARFLTAKASPTGHRQLWLPAGDDPAGTPAILLDPETGKEIGKLVAGQRYGDGLEFSPDGSHIVGRLVGDSAMVGLGVWRSDDAAPLVHLDDLPFWPAIRMSDDGSRLLIFASNTDGPPVLVDRVAGALVDVTSSLLGEPGRSMSDAAISPDGRTVVMGDAAGHVSVRWLGQPKPGSDAAYLDEPVKRILMSPGGSVFAVSGEQGALAIGDTKSAVRLMHVVLAGEVAAMCFLSETRIAATDGERVLRVFDLSREDAPPLAKINLLEGVASDGIEFDISDMTCTEDGRLVFINSFGGWWGLDWNSATQLDLGGVVESVATRGRGAVPRLFGHGRHWSLGERAPPGLADPAAGELAVLSAAGDRALMREMGGEASLLIDSRSWTTLRRFDDTAFPGSLEFSDDGMRVVHHWTSGPDNEASDRLEIWDSALGYEAASLQADHGHVFEQVAFDARGNRFILSGDERPPTVLTIVNGRFEEIQTPAFADFSAAQSVATTLLSQDGNVAILGGSDGSVHLVSVGTMEPALRVEVGDTVIDTLVISDDDGLVAAADAHNLVVIDIRTATVRSRLRLDAAPAQLRFLGTDRLLVADAGGRLRIFHLWPDNMSQIDWLRATLVPFASDADRQRFGIPARNRSDRPDLRTLGSLPPDTIDADKWMSLALVAASDTTGTAGLTRALSMLAGAGMENPAEAAMQLALQLAARGDDAATTRRAFYLASVGFEIDATADDLPDFTDSARRLAAADLVRDAARAMSPDEIVDAYREARDWRANDLGISSP